MKNYGKVILTNAIIAVVVLVLSVIIFPHGSNAVVYRGIILNLPWVFPITGAALLFFLVAFPLISDGRTPLGAMYATLAAIILIGGCVAIGSGTNWKTCQLYSFNKRDKLIRAEKQSIRFTPLQVAYKDLVGSLNSSKHTVEEEEIDAIDLNGAFGYVVPISPDGPLNTFIAENDGFMAFDDVPNLPDDQRVKRVHQKYAVGEGMEWLDNVWRALYSSDWWCVYDNISYLQLDSNNPEKFIGVAPKIKYEYHFPLYVVPVWGGVALVHEDGKIEQLNVEEAKKDKRLQGKRIFPSSLALKLVETQIYDQGFLGGWYNREGKIKVPSLPGKNQMPFFTPGEDGNEYFVVATEPAGEAFALFRLYYTDSNSGERTYYEFDLNKGVLGPNAAVERVKTLQGYKWLEGGNGDHQIIEPVYLTDNVGRLFWKYTITTKTFTGITATAVVDAASRDVRKFDTRKAFNGWLYGYETPTASAVEAVGNKPSLLQRIGALREAIDQMTAELDLLEKDVKAEGESK